MHFIYGLPVCSPLCPPLSNDKYVSSSDENLHHQSNFVNNQKVNTYAKQIGRHFIFSSSSKKNFYDKKDIDEEFDQISLSDNYSVSLIQQKLFAFYLTLSYFHLNIFKFK